MRVFVAHNVVENKLKNAYKVHSFLKRQVYDIKLKIVASLMQFDSIRMNGIQVIFMILAGSQVVQSTSLTENQGISPELSGASCQEWEEWQMWNKCSQTCDGMQKRRRVCSAHWSAPSLETRACNVRCQKIEAVKKAKKRLHRRSNALAPPPPDPNYLWPLTELNSSQSQGFPETLSAVPHGDGVHDVMKVLTIEGDGYVECGGYTSDCLSNPELCPGGVSISFWLKHGGLVSHILKNNEVYHSTLNSWLSEKVSNISKWIRCYHARVDGWEGASFHAQCGGKGPTVTLIRVREFVFGGFLGESWDGALENTIRSDSAFIFSLHNADGLPPFQLPIQPEKADAAVNSSSSAMPIFGLNDIFLSSPDANATVRSFTELGSTYSLPEGYTFKDERTRNLLAGSHVFSPDDIEVFYNKDLGGQSAPSQNEPIGVADPNVIHNHRFSASSWEINKKHAPWQGRLGMSDSGTGSAWCAKQNNLHQWLQVDLTSSYSIQRAEVQGEKDKGNRVTKFKIGYSLDAVTWTYTEELVTDASAGDDDVVIVYRSFNARYVRFLPTVWKNNICMRVELYTDNDLGLGDRDTVADSQFSASSSKGDRDPPYEARLGASKHWCALSSDTASWLQVDLGAVEEIVAVATQGSGDGFVTTFSLRHSVILAFAAAMTLYNEQGSAKIFYGNSDADDEVTNLIAEPFQARYVQFIPVTCSATCCLRVEVYRSGQVVVQELKSVILASGDPWTSTGLGFYRVHNPAADSSTYTLRFATATKLWELHLADIPSVWLHVAITWSDQEGLKYYENGVLIDSNTISSAYSSQAVANPSLMIGKTTLIDSQTVSENMQMFWLAIWERIPLTSNEVEQYMNKVFYPQGFTSMQNRDDGDFNWVQSSECTPSSGTGPCAVLYPAFFFIEASFPRTKGERARIATPYTLNAYNCLQFAYNMHGSDIGRLNVFLENSVGKETLVWRLAGNQGERWKRASMPVNTDLTYRIVFVGVVGDGYKGDIAISDVSLSRDTNCQFTPAKVRDMVQGIRSEMIGHIPSYTANLSTWLSEEGFGNKSWAPCYSSSPESLFSKVDVDNKCVGKGPIIGIVRVNDYVFGFFFDQNIDEDRCQITGLPQPGMKAFLYSLKNSENLGPRKMRLMAHKRHNALRCKDFQFGRGLVLTPPNKVNSGSFTAYSPPAGAGNAETFFFGSEIATLSQLEILQVSDTVCYPACPDLQKCDELTGKCFCDNKERYVEWCREGSPSPLEQLTSTAAFYWPMEDPLNIKDLKAPRWGIASGVVNNISKGIQNRALGLTNNGWIDLGEITNLCIGCQQESTISFWLKHINKEPNVGQTFLKLGSNPGLTIFQINGSFEHLAIKVPKLTEICRFVFVAAHDIWSHLTLVGTSSGLTIYYNAVEVTNFLEQDCVSRGPGISVVEVNPRLTLGKGSLPLAAYDEIIIWTAALLPNNIQNLYNYYKGLPNLEVSMKLNLPNSSWSEELVDRETQEFIDLSTEILDDIGAFYNESDELVYPNTTTVEKFESYNNVDVQAVISLLFKQPGYDTVHGLLHHIWITSKIRVVAARLIAYSTINDVFTGVVPITVIDVTAHTLTLSWPKPSDVLTHGIYQGYMIIYIKKATNEITTLVHRSSLTSTTLMQLSPDTEYYVALRFLTLEGAGQTSWTANTVKTIVGKPTAPPANVTAHNTSSTSILITWSEVPLEHQHYEILGYHVIYSEEDESLEENITIANGTLFSFEAEDLSKYTKYSFQVSAFNSYGSSNPSELLEVFTDEDVPDGIPENVAVDSPSSRGLVLQWNPIHAGSENGILEGYKIFLFDTMRNITVERHANPDVTSIVIRDLKPFTEYIIETRAYTGAGNGNASLAVTIVTEQEAPDQSPSNATSRNSSSTSILVTWRPVHKFHINGILLGYRVIYFETESTNPVIRNITVHPPIRSRRNAEEEVLTLNLEELKKFTMYTIRVLAFTIEDGVYAEMNLSTAQDTPSHPPTNAYAFDLSSTEIMVRWRRVPEDHVNGILRGYYMYYHRTDKPFQNVTVVKVDDSSASGYLIDSLEKFTPYRFTMAAFTDPGIGNMSDPFTSVTAEDVPDSPPTNVSGHHINETAITVDWLKVPEDDENGIILGFDIKIHQQGHFVTNVTVLNASQRSLEFGALRSWTNYTVTVCAFTVIGQGPYSPDVIVQTDEEAPDIPPRNVSGQNTSSTSILVEWKSTDFGHVRGTVRGYRVYYVENGSLHTSYMKNETVDGNAVGVELVNLYKYTKYHIYVVAFTTKEGVPSETLEISTDEDTPDAPPANIQLSAQSSTSIAVTWEPVPPLYQNGIILGYEVYYGKKDNKDDPREILSFGADVLSTTVFDLGKFTNYTFVLLAFTRKGNGVSEMMEEQTDEDIPGSEPQETAITNRSTTTTIPINWDKIPSELAYGEILGFRVRYQLVKVGDIPVINDPVKEMVIKEGLSAMLTDLESYGLYKIELTGFTIKGDGPVVLLYGETCRCEKRLATNWNDFSPYVTKEKDGSPGGIIPEILNNMTIECCQTCKSHGKSYIDFLHNGNNKTSYFDTNDDMKLNMTDDTELSFPVFGYKDQTHYGTFGFKALVESPGVAFIVNTDFSDHPSEGILTLTLACWPYLVIAFLTATIAGILLWMLETGANSTQFPRGYFRGSGEGLWWSFITMTTVGYGDRVSTTRLGKIFCIVWMLVGLVIFGILTGYLATALTNVTMVDSEASVLLYGTEVAAIHDSAEYRLGVRMNAKINTKAKPESFEEVYNLLINNKVKGALIETYAIGTRKDLFEKPNLRIVKIFDHSSAYGVVLSRGSNRLQTCYHGYMQMHRAAIFKQIERNIDSMKTFPTSLVVERSTGLFDLQSRVYQTTVAIAAALLLVAFLIGTLWEFIINRRRTTVKSDVSKTSELKADVALFVENFNDIAIKLKEKIINDLLSKQRTKILEETKL